MDSSIRSICLTTLSCVLFFISGVSNSALVGRLALTEGGTDYQAYYDTETNLTWLQDANYAFTSGYNANGSINGLITWANTNAWAAELNINGVTGWRLPETQQSDTNCSMQSGDGQDYGVNCTVSEMGNLFYNVLGGVAYNDIATTHNANYDLFSNIQSQVYWSATEHAIKTNFAWYFNFGDGYQGDNSKTDDSLVWAVHSGDVSAVPLPAAVWLFGSGLLGLFVMGNRKGIKL